MSRISRLRLTSAALTMGGLLWCGADAVQAQIGRRIQQEFRRYSDNNSPQYNPQQDPHAHEHSDFNQHGYYEHYQGATIQYGQRTHLDALTADLKDLANKICWDMHGNYRDNPGHRDTYREAYQMLQDAKHIYTLVYEDQYHRHQHAGPEDHIARDLADIDQLFHHIEGDIANWRPARQNPYHDEGTLHAKMEAFEDMLHHLMEDYGVKSTIDHDHQDAPPPDSPGPPPRP